METPPTDHEENNEANALTAIIDWSQDCPPWQRDALRRLCTKDQLDASDLDGLIAICKKDPHAVVDPISAEHVRDPSVLSEVVILKRIHGVQHVNALAEGEELTFDKIGLTVVYGDNGSGKSGYARILKKACRSRSPRNETILPNIYATAHGQPTAIIDFSVDKQNDSSVWTLNKPGTPALSAVSVFDSRTANIHVEETNDIAYTPLPLKILASLAQACQDLKQRLNNEISTLEQQTPIIIRKPTCQSNTVVGKLMSVGGCVKRRIVGEVIWRSGMAYSRALAATG